MSKGFTKIALLLLGLILLTGSAFAQGWVVVNFSSQPNAVPAMGEVEMLPDLAKLAAVTDGERIYAVGVDNGKVYVDCVAPPMSTMVLRATFDQPERPVLVSSENGIARFSGGGMRVEPGATLVLESADWKTQLLEHYLVPKAAGDTVTLDSPIDLVFAPGKQVMRLEKNGKWTLKDGAMTGTLSALVVAPAKPVGIDGTVSAAAAFHPIIGRKTDDRGWRFVRNGASANIYMRGANTEYPDIEDDIWAWSDMQIRGLGAWAFSKDGKASVLRCYDLGGIIEGQMINMPQENNAYFRLPGHEGGGENTLKPVFEIFDPTGRGLFLQGDLLSGGPIFASNAKGVGAMDLDNDGDVDLFIHGIRDVVASRITSSGFNFDMSDELHGFYVPRARKPGVFTMDTSFRYTDKMGQHTWMFSKTLLHGRVYDGAGRGFEEHLLYRVPSEATDPIKGFATYFLKTGEDKIDRMSMGAFGGSPGNVIDWNVELDPTEAWLDQPESYRICQYTDTFGRSVRFTSCVYPETWDGRALPLRRLENGAVDFTEFAAWERMAKGDYFELSGIKAVYAPEGSFIHSTEGMYTGHLHSGCRAEIDKDKPEKFTLYYSPLFGGLHLVGADYGYIGFDTEHNRPGLNELDAFYHKDAVDMPGGRWIGGREVHDLEGCRLECPMFLPYVDMDRDGFQDAYLWDAVNDGNFERTLRYDDQTHTALLRENEKAVAFPYQEEREQVLYLIGNYNIIEDMYLKGLKEAPLVVRASFPEVEMGMPKTPHTGLMTENPEESFGRYVFAGDDWKTVIALDSAHGGFSQEGWTDFREKGFTGLGLHAQNAGLTPELLTEPFSRETLAGVDILVMQQPMTVIPYAEMLALVEWIQAGGALLVAPSDDNAATRIALNGALEPFGIALKDDRHYVRSSIHKYGLQSGDWHDMQAPVEEKRYPSPGQKIEHYSSEIDGLLDRMRLLTCVGFPLEISDAWTTVLAYEGKPVMAEAELGEGCILVSGINLVTNRYLNHVQYLEPQADNTWLISRLVERLANRFSRLDVRFEKAEMDEDTIFTISGNGGDILYPKRLGAQAQVNGAAMGVRAVGDLFLLNLPAGESRVILSRQ